MSNRVKGHTTSEIIAGARKFHLPNQWPPETELPFFKPKLEVYFDAMSTLASKMWRYFDVVIQSVTESKSQVYSEKTPVDPGMYTINVVHYPKHDPSSGKPPSDFGISDHTDWEGFTLLYPCFYDHSTRNTAPNVDDMGYTYTGLEVYYKGQWVAVPHIPGAIIVNQGEMLSRMSHGRLKPPVHRVNNIIADKNNEDKNFDRYSLVSFWGPNYEYPIPDPHVPAGEILSGEYYLKRNNLL